MSAPNQRTRQARDQINWLWEWANPVKFMWFSGIVLPWLIGAHRAGDGHRADLGLLLHPRGGEFRLLA